MVSSSLAVCIFSIALVQQIHAYGEPPENQAASGQRYSGAKILPPLPAQYPGGQQEQRSSQYGGGGRGGQHESRGAAVGGYGTIAPQPPPIQYPPVPPPVQYPPVPAPQERAPERSSQYNKNQGSEFGRGGESGLPSEPSRGGERGSSSEPGRGRSQPFESGKERSLPRESGRHPNFENARVNSGEEPAKANLGSESERYTPSSQSSRIGNKEPMAPGTMPEGSAHGQSGNMPKEGSRSEGVQYDEKSAIAKPSTFFGDTDTRNDRPLGAPTKKQDANDKAVGDTDEEEKRTECSVQPNGSPPKCAWKPNQEHHLNLWPSNMFASICESLVKTVTVCQSLCELQSDCQSIHFCPNCIGHNCRLISDKQNGKNGLKLVQEFKFVDYYEKSSC